jgi:hypothetical protein
MNSWACTYCIHNINMFFAFILFLKILKFFYNFRSCKNCSWKPYPAETLPPAQPWPYPPPFRGTRQRPPPWLLSKCNRRPVLTGDQVIPPNISGKPPAGGNPSSIEYSVQFFPMCVNMCCSHNLFISCKLPLWFYKREKFVLGNFFLLSIKKKQRKPYIAKVVSNIDRALNSDR